MLSSHLTKLHQEVASIKVCARLNSEVRRLRGATAPHSAISAPCPFEAVACPDRSEWVVYDHCAAVTRLYAVYERFVEDIVTVWLEVVPSLFTDYSELPQSLRNNHIDGVSRILPKAGEGRYKHLTVNSVVSGLFRSTNGIGGYDLPFEIFAITDKNLRLDSLCHLLSRSGVENLKHWLQHHLDLQEFMASSYAGQETVESKLNSFVSYRNEAAHGEDIAQVLGLSEFIQLCDFIEKLCRAVAERIYYCFCHRRLSTGQAVIVGRVTEKLKKADAIIGKFGICTLKEGMQVTILSESGCQDTIIQSIQINGVSTPVFSSNSETEVGLRLTSHPKVGAELLVFESAGEKFLSADI